MMPMPSPSSAPVDPDVLDMLADLQEPGEPDLLAELVTLFLRDAPERIGAIERALAASDLVGAERAAHSLKGSASNLGAMGLHGVATVVEQQARTGDHISAQREATHLRPEFARVRQHLEGVLSARTH